MEFYKKSLLDHSPEQLVMKPTELEHDDLSCSVSNGVKGRPLFHLKRSTKSSYDIKTKTDEITLDLSDILNIISKGTEILEKIDNGQIIQCPSCSSYTYAGTDYCFVCEKERAHLFEKGGNDLVEDFGYKPV